MKRRKRILAALTLVVCMMAAWLALKWINRPEMQPNYTADLGGGVMLKMIWIPGGTFEMGAEPTTYERLKRTVAGWFGKTVNLPYKDIESPVHDVTLDGFWIGETEVTQRQYEAITGKEPSQFRGPNNPVEMVSWNDATAFCRELSAKTSQTFTLPTEAQWEYACRAGSTGEFCFGDDISELDVYAWHKGNSDGRTHPAKGKKPNAWGLYDMHGSVWEYCQDSRDYYKPGRQKNPVCNSGSNLALRGGSWANRASRGRSAYRHTARSGPAADAFGFRIVRTQK